MVADAIMEILVVNTVYKVQFYFRTINLIEKTIKYATLF